MRIPLYQIDAFASRVFAGNPAAVCPLERWLDDVTLLAIAAENNLSETAFFLPEVDGRRPLRWFTPAVEVDLCGHATLATAYVVFEYLEPGRTSVTFSSRSGALTVTRDGDLLALDFPARPAEPYNVPDALVRALGVRPSQVLSAARDYLVVVENEDIVRALRPDLTLLRHLERQGIIVTGPGSQVDFVSRFFAPALGVAEDPVTGSAHCTLIPYWSERLGKKALHALQVSPRGGELYCEHRGERVQIAGQAVRYLEGSIHIAD
ncbi:MAG TPA: PhzF family phenazine biosynthesis protein [Polyangia bacterium]|nr:PhzF family phenazine biosynthesis protein [Polyangia bacterium]